MKSIKIGLLAFGMLAVMQAQAQRETKIETKEKPPREARVENGDKKGMKKFNRLDTNGDGVIVLSEMQKAKGENAKDQVNRFNKMDANKDGRVTFAEFKKAKKVKKAKKEKKIKMDKAEKPKEKPVEKQEKMNKEKKK